MNFKNLSSVFCFLITVSLFGQQIIKGTVKDKNNSPIEGANVFIENTLYGGTTDKSGNFSFEYLSTGNEIITVEALGFSIHKKVLDRENKNLDIVLNKAYNELDAVTISASSFSLGKNRAIEKMNPLDIVMTGSSNGDIVGALQSLPGTQKVGEDGKLYVRGGDSRETQTFIDGMHVLVPYTSNSPDTPSRGRFSPFLFKGINLSLGGYETEYGQALSAILPMDTKDVSSDSKLGVNVSPLSLGGGGTTSWKKNSISFNSNYTNLKYYNKMFPDIFNWKKDYENISAEGQYKTEFKNNDQLKMFFGYDHTDFSREIVDKLNNTPNRYFALNQNNIYMNSTYQTKIRKGFQYFVGGAFSKVGGKYEGTNVSGDSYKDNDQELHLKFKFRKNFSSVYKLNGGVESYFRRYDNKYFIDNKLPALQSQNLNYNIFSAFFDNQFRIKNSFYINASGRIEQNNYSKNNVFSPRTSLTYWTNNFQFSAIYGKYYQLPMQNILASNSNILNQESSNHYILSSSYDHKGITIKGEAYIKKYDDLALLQDSQYESTGYGISKGFDLYYSDNVTIKSLKFSASYSYNLSKRLYLDFPEEATPTFGSKHNARLNLLYYLSPIKTYIGLTNTFSSGRPFNDPNMNEFNSSKTTYYNSLDINASVLLSKKVILYTSLSNVLGRQNVFGYNFSNMPNANGIYNSAPITPSRDKFFFISLFISLKNNSAYDVSSF
jgi:hypothetical protein